MFEMSFDENIMIDHPGNRSKAFDMQIAELLLQFPHILLVPAAINTTQWSCCLDNVANILNLMDDTEREDFFRMNMDKYWS